MHKFQQKKSLYYERQILNIKLLIIWVFVCGYNLKIILACLILFFVTANAYAQTEYQGVTPKGTVYKRNPLITQIINLTTHPIKKFEIGKFDLLSGNDLPGLTISEAKWQFPGQKRQQSMSFQGELVKVTFNNGKSWSFNINLTFTTKKRLDVALLIFLNGVMVVDEFGELHQVMWVSNEFK